VTSMYALIAILALLARGSVRIAGGGVEVVANGVEIVVRLRVTVRG
jgi:hypothetical protein